MGQAKLNNLDIHILPNGSVTCSWNPRVLLAWLQPQFEIGEHLSGYTSSMVLVYVDIEKHNDMLAFRYYADHGYMGQYPQPYWEWELLEIWERYCPYRDKLVELVNGRE